MQIFNFRDGHMTTFRHHSGAYICQMPGHRLSMQTSKKHTFRVSAFHRYHWFGVKLFPVGYPKNAQKCCFYLAPPALQNSGIFHENTRPHLHFDSFPPKSRRCVVSI